MNEQPNLYRVHWYCGLTGVTSHGTSRMDRDLAEQWVSALNSYKDNQALLMHHWIELADEPTRRSPGSGGGRMTETMWRVVALLMEAHYTSVGYLALWHIQERINDEALTVKLAGCGVPEGDNAIERLVEMGLIEELPNLGCRYRIVIKGE